jgi:hypothetical protein
MDDPQGQLLEEITWPGMTQASVAITYAFLIAKDQEDRAADWPVVNRAISARWTGKTALERVKKLAWRQIEEWGKPKE